MTKFQRHISISNVDFLLNYVDKSMKRGIKLNGDIEHPHVSLSRTNKVIYDTPAILMNPSSVRQNIIAPINGDFDIKKVTIHMSTASIQMEMLNVIGLKSIVNTLGNTKDLYKGMYEKASNKNNSTPQEVEEFVKAWGMISNGIGLDTLEAKNWKYIKPKDVHDYFHSLNELVLWKQNCGRRSRKHTRSVTTYFGTQLTSNKSLKKTEIMNWEIQGTISDITALLIEHFDQEIKKRDLQNDILFYYCTDKEIYLNVKKSFINKRGLYWIHNEIMDIFKSQVDNWVPFDIDVL